MTRWRRSVLPRAAWLCSTCPRTAPGLTPPRCSGSTFVVRSRTASASCRSIALLASGSRLLRPLQPLTRTRPRGYRCYLEVIMWLHLATGHALCTPNPTKPRPNVSTGPAKNLEPRRSRFSQKFSPEKRFTSSSTCRRICCRPCLGCPLHCPRKPLRRLRPR